MGCWSLCWHLCSAWMREKLPLTFLVHHWTTLFGWWTFCPDLGFTILHSFTFIFIIVFFLWGAGSVAWVDSHARNFLTSVLLQLCLFCVLSWCCFSSVSSVCCPAVEVCCLPWDVFSVFLLDVCIFVFIMLQL